MKFGLHAAILASIVCMSLSLLWPAGALAVIGSAADKHNFSDLAGYGFGSDLCAGCHKPHYSSGKRLWTGDRDAAGDGLRELAPAKAESADQVAGPDDYAGTYLCLDCHSGTAAAPSWAKNAGSQAASVRTHSTREMQAAGFGASYATFMVQCTDCHDPHGYWDGTFQQGKNGFMIRSSIRTPNSGTKAVVFRRLTGPGSLADGDANYNGVCEVCHTKTKFHNNTGSTQAHNGGKDCTGCHLHDGGFAGGGCTDCHGTPPVDAGTLVGGATNPGPAATGSSTPGKHAFHIRSTVGGAGYECKVCHRGGDGDGESNDLELDVRFWAFGVSTSGSFDGFTPVNGYSFSAGNTTGGTLECRNTYCHGNFSGGAASNAPVWTDASTGDCGSCHSIAPPGLQNHSVHLTAVWGPKAACDDCHPAGSSGGMHASHVNGAVDFGDGQAALADTTVCDGCHGCTAATKPVWGTLVYRGQTFWCKSCHDGSSVVNTAAGTGGADTTAPSTAGNGLTYGFDVSGHGKIGIGLSCMDCHDSDVPHIDGSSPSYTSAQDNFRVGYRLMLSNDVPLLSNYSSSRISLCFNCHREDKLLGMPAEGRPSALHVHSVPIAASQWYTNFRNVSTTDGLFAGNWDSTSRAGYTHDVPTNIHWNHMDDYGSSRRESQEGYTEKMFDSDKDGTGDSYVTCETCHNPHGTEEPAMVLDDFSLVTHSVSGNPSYVYIGSAQYNTTRCTEICHTSGNAQGTAGTRWYRTPTGQSTVFGTPLGLSAEPLP